MTWSSKILNFLGLRFSIRTARHSRRGTEPHGPQLLLSRPFYDNQDGILESNFAGSHILIEFNEFDNNGFATGQAHNLYIGHAAELTCRFNSSHNAVGPLLNQGSPSIGSFTTASLVKTA